MILQNYDLLAGARVADLFCGVGSLGLEAISRGAASVTFVEKNSEIAEVLEKNIAKAGFGERSRVVRASAFRVGAPLGPGGERYDLVFVDPPYAVTQEVGAGARRWPICCGSWRSRWCPREWSSSGPIATCRPWTTTGLFHAVDRRQWGTMSVVLLQARADEQQASGD